MDFMAQLGMLKLHCVHCHITHTTVLDIAHAPVHLLADGTVAGADFRLQNLSWGGAGGGAIIIQTASVLVFEGAGRGGWGGMEQCASVLRRHAVQQHSHCSRCDLVSFHFISHALYSGACCVARIQHQTTVHRITVDT